MTSQERYQRNQLIASIIFLVGGVVFLGFLIYSAIK